MEYSSPFPVCEALDKVRVERAFQRSVKRANTPPPGDPKRVPLWPSMASFKQTVIYPGGWEDTRVIGTCLRQSFYMATRAEPTDPKDVRVMDAGEMGNAIEDLYVKEMKHLPDYEVLHPSVGEDGKPRQLRIDHRGVTGKVDIILLHVPTGTKVGVEMKTYDNPRNAISYVGYDKAKAIYKSLCPYIPKYVKGSRTKLNPERFKKPFPKESHLMQTLIYLDALWDEGVRFFKIIYVARDRGPRAEFDVTLGTSNGRRYAVVNDELLQDWPLDGIYARYAEVKDHVARGDLPDRDFVPEYDTDALLDDPSTPKWLAEKVKGGQIHRDWNCDYCPFLGRCLDDGASKPKTVPLF